MNLFWNKTTTIKKKLIEAFTGGLEVVLKFVLRDESVFSCDLNHFGRKRVFSFEKSKKRKKFLRM